MTLVRVRTLLRRLAKYRKCSTDPLARNGLTGVAGRYRNYIGNNGMAKGGSGDFLTGLIAGFVAQGISEEIAAASGVYFHALTGDVTAGILGKRAMLPSDMFEYLPEVFEGMGW